MTFLHDHQTLCIVLGAISILVFIVVALGRVASDNEARYRQEETLHPGWDKSAAGRDARSREGTPGTPELGSNPGADANLPACQLECERRGPFVGANADCPAMLHGYRCSRRINHRGMHAACIPDNHVILCWWHEPPAFPHGRWTSPTRKQCEDAGVDAPGCDEQFPRKSNDQI